MNAPTRVGRYEILRRLGKGMTDVYLAQDIVENRRVALKVAATGGDAMNRLIVEAERRGAAIQKELQAIDPRMVAVYEAGEIDGYFYVAMQYVEGRTLAEVLRSERTIDPVRAAAIALELCEQLAKFHSAASAVVHGDVKPSNIHLGHHDTVRLLDFGIAKTLRAGNSATEHGFGSPGYCAPERLERSQVDQHSDLWAVGATLYEMLAGMPAYQAENTRKLEGLIRSKRPPRALPASIPRGLRAVVGKALAANPGQRYGSARSFQADLQAFLEHRQTAAERERRGGHTIDAARVVLRKATLTLRRARRHVQAAAAVGWFATGMLLWIGGTWSWQVLQARPKLAPPQPPGAPVNLPLLYRAKGEEMLRAREWKRAAALLQRAVELGNTDAATLSDLALAHAGGVVVAPPRVEPVKKLARKKTVRRTSGRRSVARWRR